MNIVKKNLKISDSITEEYTIEEILLVYEPFLKSTAYKYSQYARSKYFKHSFYFDYDDIKQVEYMAAVKSYDEYDIEKGYVFYTFLSMHVNMALKRYITNCTNGRRIGLNEYDLKTESLDSVITCDDSSSDIKLQDIIADDSSLIDDIVENDNINYLLSQLNEREQEIIKLNLFEGIRQLDIALIYNISQVTVSRILTRAYHKMKKKILEDEGDTKIMIKYKPTTEEAIKYLKENANQSISFSKATVDYAKSLNLSFTTMLGILKKSDEYEDMKSLYKDTSKTYNPHKANKPIKSILDILHNDITEKEIITEDIEVKAEVKPVIEPEVIDNIAVNNKQRLIDINNIEIKAGNNCSIKVIDNNCEFHINGVCFNEDQITDLKKNIDKALEIYNIVK